MIRTLLLGIFGMALALTANSQEALPAFDVVGKPNKRNLISWNNSYRRTSQISIQRSVDSTRNFKTILTVPDPAVPQNGFVDSKAPQEVVFYRLFIVLDSGKYVFTKSKRPGPDTVRVALPEAGEPLLANDNKRVVVSDSMSKKEVTALTEKLKPPSPSPTPSPVLVKPMKYFVIKRRDSVVNRIPEKALKKFRDSIVYSTRDTLVFQSLDTIQLKPFVPREVYKPSKFVYTEKFGNVMINLPEPGSKKYRISFFDDKHQPVFELKEVKRSPLILDKASFVHSGWFWFELYEEDKLKEKHRFFIPKDF